MRSDFENILLFCWNFIPIPSWNKCLLLIWSKVKKKTYHVDGAIVDESGATTPEVTVFKYKQIEQLNMIQFNSCSQLFPCLL